MNETQELMIQRLVDDQLDEQERIEFLKLAESQPDLWRETVLSLMEDRMFSIAVANSVTTSRETNESVAAVDGAGTEKVRAYHHKPWWTKYGPQILMTAASVLFVLTLALQFNPINRGAAGVSDGGVASSSASPDSRADQPEPLQPGIMQPEPLGPEGTQWASEPYQLRMDDMEFPVFEDREQFRQELQRTVELDPEFLHRFSTAGYQLKPDVRYISGKLPDGRSVVVPVQSFQINRIGQ